MCLQHLAGDGEQYSVISGKKVQVFVFLRTSSAAAYCTAVHRSDMREWSHHCMSSLLQYARVPSA